MPVLFQTRRSKAESSEARLKQREQVFALLSHEMRTPLNGVLGMAGLLASTKLDATQQAYLAALRECGEHLLSLVNDVLDLAKLDAGRIELEPVQTDVERLLQGVCELLSPRAHAAGIDIACTVASNVPMINADDGRLRQILFNLAGNAVKMTAKGGVLLTAEVVEGGNPLRLRFSVRDTGPGLAPEAQARIFEEFVQTEDGVRAGGAGLGLAIVRRLADAFGGAVGVESEPGAGAAFWFEADFEPAGEFSTDSQLEGLIVAVVSPSQIVREAAVRQIEASGGQAVACASLAQLKSHGRTFAAVLVDAGPEAASVLRPPRVGPAIVLLAPEARERIEEFRTAGFAGYLIKPLRRGSLASRILAVRSRTKRRTDVDRRYSLEDERAARTTGAGLRVLLVEDNPVNALLARALLTREGYEVDRVATGQEALAATQAAPYDVVLMDMRMPGLDGPATTRALRARGDRTPIIALTANAFDDDRRTCLDAGMNDFLTKPLDPAALSTALMRWTRREARAAS